MSIDACRASFTVALVVVAFVTLGPSPLRAQDKQSDVVSSERVDASSMLAALEAQGVDLKPFEPSGKQIRFKTLDEHRAARFADVLDRAHRFPSEDVRVTIQLRKLDTFAELTMLRELTVTEREDALGRRAAVIADAQRDFRAYAAPKGARVLGVYRLRNRLVMDVPTAALSDLLSHPEVLDVYPGWHKAGLDWTVQEIRDQTFLQEFHDANYYGVEGGSFGGSPPDPVQISIVETGGKLPEPQHDAWRRNRINSTHLNWALPSSMSRLLSAEYCESGSCVSSVSNDLTHCTIVGGIAAGGRWQFGPTRAGMAPDSTIRAYIGDDNDLAAIGLALDRAIAGGADVINQSWGNGDIVNGIPTTPEGLGCDNVLDRGLNDIIADAYDAGIVVTKSTGNNDTQFPAGVCSANYPTQRPEQITVGSTGAAGDPLPYLWSDIWITSSRGWMQVGRGGTYGGTFPMSTVSLVAPGRVDDEMGAGCCTFGGQNFGTATSWSTPVVAGAAALFKNWMNDHVPSKKDDPGHIRAMVLAMSNNNGSRLWDGDLRAGVSEVWGAGKLMAHPPHLLAGGDFRQTKVNVQEGTTYLTMTLPSLPAATNVLKVASYVEVRDLTQVPQILLLVRDRCDLGRTIGYDVYVAEDKYVRISGSTVGSGICPNVELHGFSVPPGGVNVYTFAYWTSGPAYEH